MEEKPKRRKGISKAIKKASWERYFPNSEVGKCITCRCDIVKSEHHAGHIISDAHGGPTVLENLVPMCATCNTSIGKNDLVTFMSDHRFAIPSTLREAHDLVQRNIDSGLYNMGVPVPPPKKKIVDPARISWSQEIRKSLAELDKTQLYFLAKLYSADIVSKDKKETMYEAITSVWPTDLHMRVRGCIEMMDSTAQSELLKRMPQKFEGDIHDLIIFITEKNVVKAIKRLRPTYTMAHSWKWDFLDYDIKMVNFVCKGLNIKLDGGREKYVRGSPDPWLEFFISNTLDSPLWKP